MTDSTDASGPTDVEIAVVQPGSSGKNALREEGAYVNQGMED